MTKEEIINKAIELEFGSGNAKSIRESNSSLVKVAEHLYDLMTAFLPSNLDEAAIPESEMVEWMEYGPHTNYPWCSIPDAIKITAEHFFALGKQAGAEWMAGQISKAE